MVEGVFRRRASEMVRVGKSFQKFGYKEEKKERVTAGVRCRIKESLLYLIF